jgi:hypothetical protein
MMLVPLMIAAVLGFIVWRDAQLLEARGVRVGRFSPATWGVGTFLLAIVFGVWYLVLRAGAVRPPASRCPNCARPAQAGDQFCATCGCPLPSGADHDRQG